MRLIRVLGLAVVLAALIAAPARAAAPPATVAALQAALQSLSLYRGHVDGIEGPLTRPA